MTLTVLNMAGDINYLAESSDIVGEKIAGAAVPGKVVFIIDTGRRYIIEADLTLTEMSEGAVTLSSETKLILGKNDLGNDAWGRQKVVFDYSLFHGVWTFDVPNRLWKQYNDTGAGWVEQGAIDNNLVKSDEGMLRVTGTSASDVLLQSKRNPRYQPNRGHLYSTAAIFPSPNISGSRIMGVGTSENRVFLKLEGDGATSAFYVGYRTTVNGVTTDYETDITSYLPEGFDFSKGHVYDIQMEWRGVGNFYIYVDLELVYTVPLLGTLTGVSVANPALPVFFEVKDAEAGSDVILKTGCVDVTSEGGAAENLLPATVSTGDSLLSTSSGDVVALLAVRSPNTVTYNGDSIIYTRDAVLDAVTSFVKDEAFHLYYRGRLVNTSALSALSSWQSLGDGFLEYRTNSDDALDTAFQTDLAAGDAALFYSTRGEKDFAVREDISTRQVSKYYLSPGDIFIFAIKSDGNSTAGLTVELSEEI